MELLETQDPEKKRLIEASDRHRRELEREVKSLSEKTEKMLINALVIGGSLALTYYIVSQWSKSKKKKKAKKSENGVSAEGDTIEEPSVFAQIGSKVMNQVTLVLLDIAKDKLLDYLESRKTKDENS
jgi:hypothetical protein